MSDGPSTIRVCEEALQWVLLLGRGQWTLVDVSYDPGTVPPTPWYTLMKEKSDD